MISSAIGNFIGTYFVTLTFQTAIFAGVNQGVVSTLFVLSAVFCAILAYFLFNEKMDVSQYFGMVLLIACAVLLSISQEEGSVQSILEEDRISGIIPVMAAIASSLGFGVRSIIIKYYAESGYDVYNFAMQSLFVDGLIGSLCPVYQYYTTVGIVTGDIIIPGILSGIIAGVGTFLINYAISVGIAGPASAMANLASVTQTLLDYFLLGQVLNLLQILGLSVGLLGAMVIAVGYPLYKKASRMCL